jgi:hypothetical protein
MKERDYHSDQDKKWDTTDQPRGLGDTIAKITRVTRIDKLVRRMSEDADSDCGCKKRQEALNKVFPYKKHL